MQHPGLKSLVDPETPPGSSRTPGKAWACPLGQDAEPLMIEILHDFIYQHVKQTPRNYGSIVQYTYKDILVMQGFYRQQGRPWGLGCPEGI